jgi:hypothetical protein
MVALNIFSIFVDSLLPPFNQTMDFRPVQVALPAVLTLAKTVLQCPGSGVNFSPQSFFKKDFCDGLLRRNISDSFSLWDEIDESEKWDIFVFQYSSRFSLFFLRQEFQKTDHSTVCHEVLLLLLQHPNPLSPVGQFQHLKQLHFKQTFMNASRVSIINKENSTAAL